MTYLNCIMHLFGYINSLLFWKHLMIACQSLPREPPFLHFLRSFNCSYLRLTHCYKTLKLNWDSLIRHHQVLCSFKDNFFKAESGKGSGNAHSLLQFSHLSHKSCWLKRVRTKVDLVFLFFVVGLMPWIVSLFHISSSIDFNYVECYNWRVT